MITHDFPTTVSGFVRMMVACAALLVLQSCSEPLSVSDLLRNRGDRHTDVAVETQLVVTEDGRVSASGPVQDVSKSSLTLADAAFDVTPRTSLTDVASRPMKLSDVEVGTFLQLEGVVAEDGSFEAVSVQEDHTVMVCHVPPGNADNAHTISVGERAVETHLNHGDYEGECEVESTGEETDGEEDTESDDPEDEDGEKVAVCHIPPGNPDNARTLNVDVSDLQDHLDHGDYEGECEEETSGDLNDEEESESDDDSESDDLDEEKVLVCHVPPGNPDNAHTISIGISDLQDHLDHGDFEGECVE